MVDLSKFGSKHTCYKCGCKFYDLKKLPILCPKCAADQAAAPPPAEVVVKPIKAAPVAEPADPEFEEESEEIGSLDGEEFPILDDTDDFEDEPGMSVDVDLNAGYGD